MRPSPTRRSPAQSDAVQPGPVRRGPVRPSPMRSSPAQPSPMRRSRVDLLRGAARARPDAMRCGQIQFCPGGVGQCRSRPGHPGSGVRVRFWPARPIPAIPARPRLVPAEPGLILPRPAPPCSAWRGADRPRATLPSVAPPGSVNSARPVRRCLSRLAAVRPAAARSGATPCSSARAAPCSSARPSPALTKFGESRGCAGPTIRLGLIRPSPDLRHADLLSPAWLGSVGLARAG